MKHERLGNVYNLRGKYGKIVFPNNIKAIFDKEDYDTIVNYHWRLSINNHLYTNIHGVQTPITEIILKGNGVYIPEDKMVDHIDRNPLNNTKINLRICSVGENAFNKSIRIDNTSGKTGVYKYRDKWVSKIGFHGKLIHLGYFEDFGDAVKARELAEKEYFGKFAP